MDSDPEVGRPAGPEPYELPASNESSTLLVESSAASTISSLASSTSLTQRRQLNLIRAISFGVAFLSALCGNSVSVFSLYSPLFQQRLRYNQFQVNGLAIAASLSLYLPVPIFGYICDRFGPTPLSTVATVFFGLGYGVAAGVYRYVDNANKGIEHAGEDVTWTYPIMVASFVAIGIATCGIYLSSVAVTAKNFGKGKYRGLALAVPIAAFGLSGMWLSQFGSWVLCEWNPDGTRGDVDVFKFFGFLAALLVIVSMLGIIFLRVVNEEEMIEEAVEELAHSGILDGGPLLGRSSSGYGTLSQHSARDDEEVAIAASLLDPDKDDEIELAADARWKKDFLLNAETRRFLADHTMWWLAIGFFLIIGPGEAFINNMGTIIGTLYNPSSALTRVDTPTSPATHVSVVAFTSTAGRLLTGTLSDLLAPFPHTDHPQLPGSAPSRGAAANYSVSRVSFLLFFAASMSLGFLTQASGLVQEHGERFWIVSSLIGLGYGGVFSITPIIITVIWGVENFATNWGIVAMFPAAGSIVWGLIYSAVYEAGAKHTRDVPVEGGGDGGQGDIFCYGTRCYAPAFWAMTVSVWTGAVMALWAWKGYNGWAKRRVVV